MPTGKVTVFKRRNGGRYGGPDRWMVWPYWWWWARIHA